MNASSLLPCLIFEDDHLLVVNKPAGLNTHAPSPYAGEGIYDWLRHREARWATLAIIQRLDKETSGVLVFAKTPRANRSLTAQFSERSVRKRYILLTDRPVRPEEIRVESTLVRAGDKYVSRPLAAGVERAETRFRLIGRGATGGAEPEAGIPSADLGLRNTEGQTAAGVASGYAMVQAEPLTGRTHQIRVHAAESGFPILGDRLYGGTAAARVYLHAKELRLKHPVSGEEMTFSAPPVPGRASAPLAASPESDSGPVWWRGPLPCLALREALIEAECTNACRLVHGASDGWPGWYVERLGEFLLSQSERPLMPTQRAMLARLAESFGARAAYHKLLTRTAGRAARAEASPQLVFGTPAPERFTVRENGIQFELSFAEGYSVGLFLDQRDNRRRLLTRHVGAGFPLVLPSSAGQQSPCEVLNAFAYTCGFSVCAAKAGARTTSLDLSRKWLEWGQRNFALNQLDPAAHEFLHGDALDWLRRLGKKGRQFDAVLLDPPTFSQSKEGGVFRAEKDYGRLVGAALRVLRRGGVLFASTNAAGVRAEDFLSAAEQAIRAADRRILQRHYVPQPPDFPIARAEPAHLKTVWLRVE